MWDHPNVTQSGGDSLVPSSSLHQTSPLELKHLFFHGDAILRSIPKEVPQRGNFSPKSIPCAAGRARSSWPATSCDPVGSLPLPKGCHLHTASCSSALPGFYLRGKSLGSTLQRGWGLVHPPPHAEQRALHSRRTLAGQLHALLGGFICVTHIFHKSSGSLGRPGMETIPLASSKHHHQAGRRKTSPRPTGSNGTLSLSRCGTLNIQQQLCPRAPGNPAAPVTAALLWSETSIN